MITCLRLILLLLVAFCSEAFAQEEKVLSKAELAKINKELDNPLAKYWSLVFQENYSINKGNLVDGSVTTNTMFF